MGEVNNMCSLNKTRFFKVVYIRVKVAQPHRKMFA